MNIPGFSAEASLYKTSRHYRGSGEFDQADGSIYPALSISDFLKSSLGLADLVATTRDLGSLGYVDNPFPFAIPCGALGKACCRAPAGSQNISAFGPLVSCQERLGCDITTNKCVSPCGGPGQVCCDGPETRAVKWTAAGEIYSPNSWNMREMCDTGVCDKQTHRCITCGTQTGGPCCSSDASQATARCFRDAQTGNRLVCNDPWGSAGSYCVECGKGGQPKCSTSGEAPCDDGLVERESDGTCVFCGWAGHPHAIAASLVGTGARFPTAGSVSVSLREAPISPADRMASMAVVTIRVSSATAVAYVSPVVTPERFAARPAG